VASTFGSFFRELRIKRGWTLRRFCEVNGYDAENISRLERGLFFRRSLRGKLREFHPESSVPIPIEEIAEIKCGLDTIPLPGLRDLFEIDGFISSDLSPISGGPRTARASPKALLKKQDYHDWGGAGA
jgi:transcriptional regulator with XRE-family HTH domain